jgi:hypothetical protein
LDRGFLTSEKLLEAARTYRFIESGQSTKPGPLFTITKSDVAEILLRNKPREYYTSAKELAEELGFRELIEQERAQRLKHSRILELSETGEEAKVETGYVGKRRIYIEEIKKAEEIPEELWEKWEQENLWEERPPEWVSDKGLKLLEAEERRKVKPDILKEDRELKRKWKERESKLEEQTKGGKGEELAGKGGTTIALLLKPEVEEKEEEVEGVIKQKEIVRTLLKERAKMEHFWTNEPDITGIFEDFKVDTGLFTPNLVKVREKEKLSVKVSEEETTIKKLIQEETTSFKERQRQSTAEDYRKPPKRQKTKFDYPDEDKEEKKKKKEKEWGLGVRKFILMPKADLLSMTITEARLKGKKALHPAPTRRNIRLYSREMKVRGTLMRFPTHQMQVWAEKKRRVGGRSKRRRGGGEEFVVLNRIKRKYYEYKGRKRVEKEAKKLEENKKFNELVESFEAMGYDYEEAVVLAKAKMNKKGKRIHNPIADRLKEKEFELLIEAGKIRAEARRYGIELSEDDAIMIARSKKRREQFQKVIQNIQQKTAQMGAGGQQPSGLARLVNVITPQRSASRGAGGKAGGQSESWENTPPSWLGETGGGPSWLYDQSSGLSNLLVGDSGGGPHWLLGGSTDSKMANLLLGDSGGGPKWLQNQKKRGKKKGSKGKGKRRR